MWIQQGADSNRNKRGVQAAEKMSQTPLGVCTFRNLGSAGGLLTQNNLKSISVLTSPEFVAAAAESQTATPAQPPWKRLKLGSLKGWGVQRDGVGVAMSAANYTKNHWDEFKEEYLEYANAVLSADLDE
ncbi:hypothetical protein B0H14DRAFT_2604102 [Mycena olivaceomarginata]|nr:hypothetical protein B0H14DRAFT_2604102 [Mycena olivaceomarginata]